MYKSKGITRAQMAASKQAERALDAHKEMLRTKSSLKAHVTPGIEVPHA